MKKTTTKKVAVAKAASTKKIAKDISEKPVVKKTVRAKKVEESVQEVVKKPVRKKQPAQPQQAVEPVKPPVKSEAAQVAKTPKAAPIVERVEKPVVARIEKVAEKVIEKFKAPHVKAPQAVRVKSVSNRPQTLAIGVGRRKEAVARVWLKLGSGKLTVNDTAYEKYFTTQITRLSAAQPFRVIDRAQNYDVFANVVGGGVCAQADAVKLGFVRALLKLNEEWRTILRRAGLLTVDSRQKERKKYGQKGARRKFQFVKR